MNCNDVDRLLIDGPFLSGAHEHVEGCARCRALIHALNVPVPTDMPSAESIRRIEQSLRTNLLPVRPLPAARYLWAWFILPFVAAASVLIYFWGAAAIPVMSLGQTTAIIAVLTIGAGLLANSLARQMLPASKHYVSPTRLPVATFFATALAIAIFFRFEDEQQFWAHAWTCLRAGTLASLIAAVPFWLVLRRGAILSPAMTGATTGLLAGFVGTVALDAHCPNLNAWHILTGHLGAAIVCCLAGLVVGIIADIRKGSLISSREQI